MILSAEAKAFKETLSQLKPSEKTLGKIHLAVKLTFPDKRKRDFDTYLKALVDSVKPVVFEDNDRICKLTVSKFIGAGGCRNRNNNKLPVTSNDRSLYFHFRRFDLGAPSPEAGTGGSRKRESDKDGKQIQQERKNHKRLSKKISKAKTN